MINDSLPESAVNSPVSEQDDWLCSVEDGNFELNVLKESLLDVTAFDINSMVKSLPQLWQVFIKTLEKNEVQLPLSKKLDTSWQLSLVLVSDARMAVVNQQYRDKQTSTDVLTFPAYTDSGLDNLTENLPEIDLGVILVSLDWAKIHAPLENKTVFSFVIDRFIHGLLHTFGIHHDTQDDFERVVAIQEDVLSQLGLKSNKE